MKYKAGDKVRVVPKRTKYMNCDGLMDCYLGKIVTIESVNEILGIYNIEEDQEGSKRNGWNWGEEMFTGLAFPQSIHITTDGVTTHAVLKEGKKVVRRAKAVCSPDDEFDLIKGAMLALARLI